MERLVLDLLLLLGFLGVSALLAGAEAAYFSLSRLGTAQLEPEDAATFMADSTNSRLPFTASAVSVSSAETAASVAGGVAAAVWASSG